MTKIFVVSTTILVFQYHRVPVDEVFQFNGRDIFAAAVDELQASCLAQTHIGYGNDSCKNCSRIFTACLTDFWLFYGI